MWRRRVAWMVVVAAAWVPQSFSKDHTHGGKHAAGRASDMPNFWFVGSSKCATSSINAAFSQHPLLFNIMENNGESHLLDGHADVKMLKASVAAARKRVDRVEARRGGATSNHILFYEYTPHYLFEEAVPVRICEAYEHLGGCDMPRYIVFIREPVARTLSSWEFKHFAKGGHLHLDNHGGPLNETISNGRSQADAMLQCWRGLGATATENVELAVSECSITTLLSPEPHDHIAMISSSHVGKSLYFYQLAAWFTAIDRRNFLVMQFEVYYANPAIEFSRILGFIGVPALGVHGFENVGNLTAAANTHINSKHREDLQRLMTEQHTQALVDIFRPHNKLLNELLELDTGYLT